jgi:hypothetical protein
VGFLCVVGRADFGGNFWCFGPPIFGGGVLENFWRKSVTLIEKSIPQFVCV